MRLDLLKGLCVRDAGIAFESGHHLPGRSGIVIKTGKDSVTVMYHELSKVSVEVIPPEVFCKKFLPDLSRDPRKMAEEFWFCQNVQRVAEEGVEALAAFLSVTDEDEESHALSKTTQENKFTVAVDGSRRTAIVTFRDSNVVQYIPLVGGQLEIYQSSVKEFDGTFSAVSGYPLERAAALFLSYALHLGATEDAIKVLQSIVPITPKELQMAIAKSTPATTKKLTPPPTTKATATKAASTAEAVPTKVAAAKSAKPEKAAKAPKVVVDRGPSAASRFCDLLREGGRTDDAIFAIVKAEFKLDDSKRSYVPWYRNHLRKKGENVADSMKAGEVEVKAKPKAKK